MKPIVFRIWRGAANGGKFVDYTTEITEGMVVLDAVHKIQATQANDLACRGNSTKRPWPGPGCPEMPASARW